MNVLFVSQNFPPEVNALANRVYHNARHWVEAGATVEVLTDVPCYPEGEVYDGYRNRFRRQRVDGIDVARVPLIAVENRGAVRRLALYISFMTSAVWHGRRLRYHPDVVVGTSPHLFNALAGYALARRRGVPFVLEIRDLWPESVVETGVLAEGHPLVRGAKRVVEHLYEHADHLVVVTEAFREKLAAGHGVGPDRVSVVRNGADLGVFEAPLDADELEDLREDLELEGKFVAAYLGTVGAAHSAEVLFEAARRCDDPELVFMVVGTGARWDQLAERQEAAQLSNFRLVPRQPRERMPYFLALSDASVVHLRDKPLFKTVLPSKIFEAMATRTPIVLGVRGESRRVVCDEAACGLFMEPEDPNALIAAVQQLRDDRKLYEQLAANGKRAAREEFDRQSLAQRYLRVLDEIVAGRYSSASNVDRNNPDICR